MHAGRVTTYALLGALMGAAGALVWKQDYFPVQRWLYAIGSVMLIFTGLWLLRGKAASAARVERLAVRLVSRVFSGVRAVRLVLPRGWRRAARELPMVRRYTIGLAWGLVPCGMVYGALPLALLAGNAPSGALIMAAFGLGTLPNLLAISGLSGYLRQTARKPAVRVASAVVVIGFGALGVVRAIWLPEVLTQHGFCVVF